MTVPTDGEKPRFERRVARDDAGQRSPVRFRGMEVIPPGFIGRDYAVAAVRRLCGMDNWGIEARYGLVSAADGSAVTPTTSEESGVIQNRPVWLVTLTGHDIPSFGGDNLDPQDELNIVLDAATGQYLFAYAFPDPDADRIRPFTPWITVQGRHRWKVRAAFDPAPEHRGWVWEAYVRSRTRNVNIGSQQHLDAYGFARWSSAEEAMHEARDYLLEWERKRPDF